MDEDEDNLMEVDPLPLGVKNGKKLTRGEKSKIAAKCRRDKENVAMNNLIKEMPIDDMALCKMDKSSVIKLAICYIKIKHFLQKDMVACEKKRLAPVHPEGEEAENADEMDVPKFTCTDGEGQTMLDALNGFLIFISRKGTIKFVSQTVTDHIGLRQENLIGKRVTEIIHPNDQHELTKQFTEEKCPNSNAITDGTGNSLSEDNQQKVFYTRMKYSKQGQGRMTGSGYILVQWSGKIKSHFSSKTGQVVVDGFVSICRPMRTTSVVEIRLDGSMFMSRHDLGMTFTFCDTRIITLIGYEPDELIGKTAYHFHNPLDAPKVSDCHQNLIVKGTSVSKYYRFLGKNDNWVWLQTRATIIYNTNNKPQYIVCMNYVISEEEGERYLMLEEHKHANNSHDNTCLTLPDNHISVTSTGQSRPSIIELSDQPCLADTLKDTAESCIEELNEENLEKTACFNGELDQEPNTSLSQGLSLASSLENGYLCNGSGQYQSVVNGYQQNGLLPRYHSAGNQQYQKQTRDQTVASPCADTRSHASNEGSPESTSSSLSPCPQQDQYSYNALDQGFTGSNSYITRDASHSNHSYSEDGGYESATSPYSSSYLSPQILSPGSLNADNRTDCGFSDHSLRKDVSQCQSSVFTGIYSGPGVCGSGGLVQGGNSHTHNKDDTAELRETENILEALLEGFGRQTETNQLDTTLAAICSTIDNFANQNSSAVTTHVKCPGVEKQKHRSVTGLVKNNKPKDKSLLRSILTMPEDDIPKHSITFLKNVKTQNTTPSSDLSRPCSEAHRMNSSNSSAQNVLDNSQARKPKTGSATKSSVYTDVLSCPDKNGSLDLHEMPSDIADFALQYLDTLTEDQTQAVIADLNTETLMDTSETDFKKELFSTITCQSPDNGFHSSCDIVTSQTPYSQSYISPLRSKQGMPQYSQTVSSSAQCTSSKSANFPSNVSSSHDHVYHQSNKFGGNGVRQVAGSQTTGGCNCSPQQSQFTQTRNCNTQMSDSHVSELEKHLRDTNDVYQPGLQYRHVDEMATAGRPFLRQLLTGELTKDRYIQMERERCGYTKGIRPQ